jgi:hypothetical protein
MDRGVGGGGGIGYLGDGAKTGGRLQGNGRDQGSGTQARRTPEHQCVVRARERGAAKAGSARALRV